MLMLAANSEQIRLHGDGHSGNILWQRGFQGQVGAPYILDFDDARMGPAVQDLWMFLSGDRDNQQRMLDVLLTAYTTFYDFDTRELQLIEPLRTLRMMRHGWPSGGMIPYSNMHFPWFNSQHYWEEHTLDLKAQMALLSEEPLQWHSWQ